MVLADAGCEVSLWGRRPELVDAGVDVPITETVVEIVHRGKARRRR